MLRVPIGLTIIGRHSQAHRPALANPNARYRARFLQASPDQADRVITHLVWSDASAAVPRRRSRHPSPGAASRQSSIRWSAGSCIRQRLRFALARTRANNLHVISTW